MTGCARRIDRARQGSEYPARPMKAPRVPPTVSVRSVRPVVERLHAIGIDAEAVLRGAGVDPARFDDPDARIAHAQALDVWQEAVRRSGDAAFGSQSEVGPT